MKELWTVLEITAYTANYESTKKHPDDPLFGITYSGKRVKQGRTVAAGPDIPMGTKIFIPDLAHWPNGGKFIVEDRGGAISNAHLDIYMDELKEALNWGRQHLEIMLLLPADSAARIATKIDQNRCKWTDRQALAELFP